MPSNMSNFAPLSFIQLKRQQERHRILHELALREIKLLERAISGTGRIVSVTSPSGVILDTKGDDRFLERAREVSLRAGFCWSETSVGTNAIGTALVEREFVRIGGSQHLLEANHFLLCNAMPVASPSGELAGVINISTDVHCPFIHSEMLVKTAVEHIEHEWTRLATGRDLLVRFHPHSSFLNTAEDGLLIFRNDLLVGATTHARRMLRLETSAIFHHKWRDIFEGRPSYGAGELRLQLDGSVVFVHVHSSQTTIAMEQKRPTTLSLGNRDSKYYSSEIRLENGDVWDQDLTSMLTSTLRALEANIPILLQGETGSGKEVFVRALHRHGSKSNAPLVPVNCAAIPSDLLEAELFGYEEGAFTGARRQGNEGYIRRAHGGVLFLDEIGEMPLAAQAQLLRVLQEREVSPLGGGRPVKVDFRLIVATNRNLLAAVRAGTFRSDLYYRVCHMVLMLPPLRERKDIAGIALAVASKYGAVRRGIRFSDSALKKIASHTWPGNMREMANVLRTVISLAEDKSVIEPGDLPLKAMASSPMDGNSNLSALTSKAIELALKKEKGNISAAAEALGIHRSTLYRWLNKLPGR